MPESAPPETSSGPMGMTLERPLEGKVALVTGGGSGIGRATAVRLAAAGARVAVLDMSGAESDTAAEIGDGAIAIRADVTDEASVRDAVRDAVDAFGGLNVVCNVAGIGSAAIPLIELAAEQFDREIAVNLRGVFLVMKHTIPLLIEAGGGAVLNWSSAVGLKAIPGAAAYAASKAGVIALTQAAAMEYGQAGVRINALCPGMVETPLFERVRTMMGDQVDTFIAMVPLGRVADPREIAELALFLVGDGASYITGVAIPVDGGAHSSR